MADRLTTKQRRFVSAYIGPAAGNATEAARLAGYKGNDDTLAVVGYDNLRNPKIVEWIARDREEVKQHAIAVLDNRVAGYDTRRNELLSIVRERSQHPDYTKVPGGRSGWLVRTFKQLGSGESAERVEEFAFDAALHRELRELEKQAAQDLGQWTDRQKVDITIEIRKRAERLADELGVPVDEVIAEAEEVAAASWGKWSASK